MDGLLLGPLILFGSAMCFTPGPNVVMITASAANFGFRRAVPHMLGVTIGFGLLIMATGLGLAGLIQAEPRLYSAVKYAGSAYLLYLAWRIAQAGATLRESVEARPIGFIEATLFQVINPKGWVIAVGALAAFTTSHDNMLLETTVIAGILATICFLSVVLWAGFGVGVGRFLNGPLARRAFNGTMAGLLVISLISVFW
jgi:threonine/homoserine/homoserine lactone efflux protein